MTAEFARQIAPWFFWWVIVIESFSIVMSLLALAVDLPPTEIKKGHGMRVLQVVLGVPGVYVIWNIYKAMFP